ncbi:hypothetical protein GWI33_016817 [Rhynchophorus ferrugineus]|uniref:Uncharacterized protein n=1 Tax=Rhynchophorus ferrugineus TaxID=354439 RepID=A0A834IAE7_RHYFE|nr:hypothetical protein GWI33_016817 [Rhynchophorus ferrugineus]
MMILRCNLYYPMKETYFSINVMATWLVQQIQKKVSMEHQVVKDLRTLLESAKLEGNADVPTGTRKRDIFNLDSSSDSSYHVSDPDVWPLPAPNDHNILTRLSGPKAKHSNRKGDSKKSLSSRASSSTVTRRSDQRTKTGSRYNKKEDRPSSKSGCRNTGLKERQDSESTDKGLQKRIKEEKKFESNGIERELADVLERDIVQKNPNIM